MGNDSLERNERAVASTLVELESKYSKALEEKILLEHELMDKANLEEALQRLKDELRDANEDLQNLRDHLKAGFAGSERALNQTLTSAQALGTPAPFISRVPGDAGNVDTRQIHTKSIDSAKLQHAEARSREARIRSLTDANNPTNSRTDHSGPLRDDALIRSASSSTSLPKRNPLPQQLFPENSIFSKRGSTTSSLSNLPASKSKGVQMVSEMRARVRNLEMKIHSRVPRLRMSSFSRSSSPRYLKPSAAERATPQIRSSLDRSSIESRSRTSLESTNRQGAESPGWVLILEETPVRKGRNDTEHLNYGEASQNYKSVAPAKPKSKVFKEHSTSLEGTDQPRNVLQRLQTLTPEPTSPRPMTPSALPMPTRAKLTSRLQQDDNQELNQISVNRRQGSYDGVHRRQSIGSHIPSENVSNHKRVSRTGGRSSLPNALAASSAHGTLSVALKGSDGEVGRGGKELSIPQDPNIPTSTKPSVFSRSRIGKPIKRLSGEAIRF